MSVILGMLAPYWQQIIGGIAAILGALGIYAKGRSDAKQKAKLDDLETANNIRKQGADARASVDSSPDGLRKPDGFERKH
jgi:hypothetical protein